MYNMEWFINNYTDNTLIQNKNRLKRKHNGYKVQTRLGA